MHPLCTLFVQNQVGSKVDTSCACLLGSAPPKLARSSAALCAFLFIRTLPCLCLSEQCWLSFRPQTEEGISPTTDTRRVLSAQSISRSCPRLPRWVSFDLLLCPQTASHPHRWPTLAMTWDSCPHLSKKLCSSISRSPTKSSMKLCVSCRGHNGTFRWATLSLPSSHQSDTWLTCSQDCHCQILRRRRP